MPRFDGIGFQKNKKIKAGNNGDLVTVMLQANSG
jgi:hypothetical protein